MKPIKAKIGDDMTYVLDFCGSTLGNLESKVIFSAQDFRCSDFALVKAPNRAIVKLYPDAYTNSLPRRIYASPWTISLFDDKDKDVWY